jgi:hypothetical protein
LVGEAPEVSVAAAVGNTAGAFVVGVTLEILILMFTPGKSFEWRMADRPILDSRNWAALPIA